MKTRKLLTVVVILSYLILGKTEVFAQLPNKPKKGMQIIIPDKYDDVYDGDEKKWEDEKELMRKNCDIMLTIYHEVPCPQRPGKARGIIYFKIDEKGKLRHYASGGGVAALVPHEYGYTSIPANWKCGVTKATGYIDVHVSGKVITKDHKKFIRFNVAPGYQNCVFISDLPQYDPLHGKKCGEGPFTKATPWEVEMPMQDGYLFDPVGGVFKFKLELGRTN